MANSWLRLWHDMPNDPKWRTIARVSKQPVSAVIATYVHLLVMASNASERGRTQTNASEDIASALDLETEQIDAILSAMQGRVLDGDALTGWSKRQVEREDGASERAKAWREAKKQAKNEETNASERNRTQTERKRTPDTDTDIEVSKDTLSESVIPLTVVCPPCPVDQLIDSYVRHLPTRPVPRRSLFKAGKSAEAMRVRWRWVLSEKYESGERKGQRMATTTQEGIAWFDRFFAYVAESDFLCGRSSEKWAGCDLAWLVTASKFESILAGRYHQPDKAVAK